MSNERYNSQRPTGGTQMPPMGGFGRGPGRPGGGMMIGGGPPMGRPAEKAKNFRGTVRRLAQYLRPGGGQLLVVCASAIVSVIFSIVSPKIMGKATTRLFIGVMMKLRGVPGAAVDFGYIGRILSLLAVFYALSAAFSYLQQYLMAKVAQKTVFAMRKDVSAKLARLPLRFFDSRTHGEILSRVTNDIENVSGTLQQSLTQLITSLMTVVGVIVMMLTISPLLTVITVVTVPLFIAVTVGVASRSQKHFAAQQKELGQLNGHVEEMYTGHVIVKAFGHERASVAEFDRVNQRLYEAGWRAQFVSGVIMPLMNIVSNLGYVLVCVVGGIMVTRRTIEIGDVQAFIQYTRQFSWPITQTANIANILQSTVASAERVFELLDEEEETPDLADARTIWAPQGAVAFRDVDFSYQPDAPLLKDLSLTVEPGRTVAIVGPTGAGKTTLVNLLMRFYELDGGEISVDGVDIRLLRRGDLRRLFGMVLQDTWLFGGTIRENIAYGREGASFEEIVRAAKAARADHFIRTLPHGYDTVLNEEASNLSQGQKQLLTIARAVLADPAVLILDEATSSVDTRTEVNIQKAMAELMQGRTSFVIAHRLSTIRDADTILVMNHGAIIEQGSHRELLARKGFYADLYNSQFMGADAAEAV